MDIDPDFVPLLQAENNTELAMAKDLLEGAQIPFVVDTSDRFEMLEVMQGSSAEGLQTVYVHKQSLDEASNVLTDAWGPEILARLRPKSD